MSKTSFVALYPTDFLADVGHLGNSELGIYTRLLLVYYRDQRPLPSDIDKLRRIAMTFSPEEGKSLLEVLAEFFVPASMPDGTRVWRHKRADLELARASEKHAARVKQTEAARRARYPNASVTESVTPSVTETVTGCSQTENQNQNQRKEHMSTRVDMPAGFQRFWAAWPRSERKVNKTGCLKQWRSKGLEQDADAICAHVDASKGSKQWSSGYEPAPLTYLNQRRWEDGEGAAANDTPWSSAL